jgi:GTP pyrophosphokinase
MGWEKWFIDNWLPPKQGRALPPPLREKLLEAFDWARERYGDAERSDHLTVMDHAARVAYDVVEFGPPDVTLLIAAVLHDLLETTDTTAEEIERRFGARIARLVQAVTNPPGEDVRDSAARAVAAGPDAVLLRLADRLAGLQSVHKRPSPAQRRFVANTRQVYLPLAEEYNPALAAEMRRLLEARESALGLPPA